MENNEYNPKLCKSMIDKLYASDEYLEMCKVVLKRIYGVNSDSTELRNLRLKIFKDVLIREIMALGENDISKLHFYWLDRIGDFYFEYEKNPDRENYNKYSRCNSYFMKPKNIHYNDYELSTITMFVNSNFVDIRSQYRIKEKEIRENDINDTDKYGDFT